MGVMSVYYAAQAKRIIRKRNKNKLHHGEAKACEQQETEKPKLMEAKKDEKRDS